MKVFLTLLNREWMEWRRVVFYTVAVISFLMLLGLFTVNRGAHHFNRRLADKGQVYIEDIVIHDDESGEEERISLDFQMEDDELSVTVEGKVDSGVQELTDQATVGFAYYIQFGLLGAFFTVLFLALFYFADSIYKERSDNSTLFYRSLPISDHMVLASKIVAGLLGIIGLSFFLCLEFLAATRVAFWILGDPVRDLVVSYWENIRMTPLLLDWLSYLIVGSTRLLPLVLFLMLVSAWVKGRPLIIGIGGPILAGITFAILFGSAAVLKSIFELFVNLIKMIQEQWLVSNDYNGGGMEVYGNFWGYLFSLETLFLLVVSAVLYFGVSWLYRRNIPTA